MFGDLKLEENEEDKIEVEALDAFRPSRKSGIVLRAVSEMLCGIRQQEEERRIRSRLSVRYVEIYNEQVTDLVTGSLVRVRNRGSDYGHDQFCLDGALETECSTLDEVVELLRIGETRKRFASTAMNDRSSRSHTIFIATVTSVGFVFTRARYYTSAYLIYQTDTRLAKLAEPGPRHDAPVASSSR